jgi:hypothetical protein
MGTGSDFPIRKEVPVPIFIQFNRGADPTLNRDWLRKMGTGSDFPIRKEVPVPIFIQFNRGADPTLNRDWLRFSDKE